MDPTLLSWTKAKSCQKRLVYAILAWAPAYNRQSRMEVEGLIVNLATKSTVCVTTGNKSR